MPADTPQEIEISVAVCTRNRAKPLANMLNTMASLRVPEGLKWELLIIDNGSSDSTAEVIAGFSDRLPIRYFLEEQAGIANARNRGADEAQGRYICWTDDDVEVDTEWLAAYAAAFKAFPDDAVFGGKIVPKPEQPSPAWFDRLKTRWPLQDIIALRDFGDEPIPLGYEGGRVPWGANFAIRAKEHHQHRFDPQLGVSPLQKRSGEESQIIFEVLTSGGTGRWVPASKVLHIFPTSRQTLAYVFDYFHAIGETWAYLDDTYKTHYMNRDGRTPRLVYGSGLKLQVLVVFYLGLYRAFRAIGMTLRSLYYLRRAGLYSGHSAYRQTMATGQQRAYQA